MTCGHCQTWIGDDEHRCPRCGRRVRSVPGRISPSTYPIAATATAPAYDFSALSAVQPARPSRSQTEAPREPAGSQQTLFAQPVNGPRVIAFDSLTSPAERESIRARAAEVNRPAPLKTERVELRRPRSAKRFNTSQQSLDLFRTEEHVQTPQASLICDAPVATAALRLRATAIDGAVMLVGCALVFVFLRFMVGPVLVDKHSAPFLVLALMTVPLAYKLLWAFAGQDTPGMREAGLRLVDFDGNPPARVRRYGRMAGGIISLLAAGMGLIWSFVDEDALTWHDHISGTFPTLASEE